MKAIILIGFLIVVISHESELGGTLMRDRLTG